MALLTPKRSDLLDLYEHHGRQIATIFLPTPSAVEDAEDRLGIRRKNVIAELESAGADEAMISMSRSSLDEIDHSDGRGVLLVLGETKILASIPLDRPVSATSVTVAPVPSLLPLLAATQTDAEHLAVLLDRTGADVLHRTGVADPIDEMEVDGPDVRVHRSHPGGWSQKRFQQTAENAWENNASEVVDQILADHPDIDIVICGGDERAVGFFVDHLPERMEVHIVDGSRHADQDAFLDAADVALRTRAARQTVARLDGWRSNQANGQGATGIEVLDHLTHGRVDHLLVVDDTTDANRATTHFDFTVPAHSPSDGGATTAAVTDGAVALAVATGSDVTVVPAHPDLDAGLSAILRF